MLAPLFINDVGFAEGEPDQGASEVYSPPDLPGSTSDVTGAEVYGTSVQVLSSEPAVSGLFPQPDSTVASTAPKFSLRFNDLDQLDSRAVLSVDNINITPNIEWDGIYQTYEDTCSGGIIEVRIGDDYTSGVVTAQLPTLDPGQHSIYYKITDKLGNTTSDTYNFFIADTAGPQVVNIYPAENSTIDVVKPVIKVTLRDDNSIVADSVYLSLNGIKVDAAYNFLNSTITYTVPQVLVNGTYKLEIKAADIFGNNTIKTWSFSINVDRTPPQVSDINPASGGIISSLSPVLSFRFYDPGGIKPGSAQIKLDGNTLNAALLYDGIYRTEYDSCTGEYYQVRIGDDYTRGIVSAQSPRLTSGQHLFSYRIVDTTENVVEDNYSFSVSDTTGPQIAECYPAAGAAINNDKPVITVKLSESNGIVAESVYLGLNGVRLNTSYDPNTRSIAYAVPERLVNGTYSLEFGAQDELGNSSSKKWLFTIEADQSGPQYKDIIPAANSKVTSVNPLISLNFTDTSQVNLNTVSMKLDDIEVIPVIEYQGIYEEYEDSCTDETYTIKVGEDNTRGKIFYQTRNLENNKEHTVEVSLKDKFANAGNYSWSFRVWDDVAPHISALVPEPNSAIEEAGPVISALICDDNAVKPDTVKMRFNGETVGSYDSTKGIISYKPAVPLLNGQYTVQVEVYDVFDNFGTTSWAFEIRHQGLPEINDLLPPPQSGTRTTQPTISAKVKDNGGIDTTKLSITIDGEILSTSFVPDPAGTTVSGTVYGVPSQDLNNGMHTAVLTVFDRAGNKQQKTWAFGVNQFGDMAVVNNDCTVCHTESIDTIERRHIAGADDCNLCHGRGIDWEPGCCYCHGHDDSYPPPVRNVPCVQCHNQTFWDAVPTHGSPAELNSHNNTQLAEDCLKCHSSYLTREHNLYVEGSGIKFDCDTCHKSTRAEVKQAISSKITACSACHTSEDHEAIHVSEIDASCKECHQETLTADHMTSRPDLGLKCETCHDSTEPKYVAAIATNNKQCSMCHSDLHNLSVFETIPSDLPRYAGFEWTQPLETGVFENEPTAPAAFVNGRLIISNRRSDVMVSDIWDFYQEGFTAGGWILVSGKPAEGAQFFDAQFTKDSRTAFVRCYNTQNGNGTGERVDSGFRIEIWYK